MATSTQGITLVGMPGAGKSTVGVLLSKRLGLDFVDTDLSIQVREGRILQDIVDAEGYQKLREIEETVLLALDARDRVVATGGSAVYSERAIRHLAAQSVIVYLDVPLEELCRRLRDYDTRGIARRPDQDLDDLFRERTLLYRHYADVRIHCEGLGPEQVVDAIIAALPQPR